MLYCPYSKAICLVKLPNSAFAIEYGEPQICPDMAGVGGILKITPLLFHHELYYFSGYSKRANQINFNIY